MSQALPTPTTNGGTLNDHYPVIVVGAGPTGLTLANLLSRYGSRGLLVERNATTVQEPRAVSIDDESLRTLQSAGVVDRVLPDIVAGYGSEYRSPGGRPFLKVEPSAQPYGYPRRNAFRQPLLEAQLRDALMPSRQVDLLFGWTLDRFEQDADRVTVHLTHPENGSRTVTCDYLVGADGARSPVRESLGMGLDGETFEEQWLIVDLLNSPAPERDTIVFCNARRPCIALPGPNQTRRFEFKLIAGEKPDDMVQHERVRTLIADHGAHPDSVICRSVVYTFHARLAPRWSAGRVFLAGDSCHLTPPFAGQGMNSCIRDAHNLAWKLAWVTSGRLAPNVLQTYEKERREHVREMIALALRMGRIMGPRNRLTGLATRSAFHALSLWPAARDYFAQMKYKPKPRFAEGFVVASDDKLGREVVGRLLPQPFVLTFDGQELLLDQILGDGFALVGIDVDPVYLDAVATSSPFADLEAHAVAVQNRTSNTFASAAACRLRFAESLLESLSGYIMLVRPDRYVVTAFHHRNPARAAKSVEQYLRKFMG